MDMHTDLLKIISYVESYVVNEYYLGNRTPHRLPAVTERWFPRGALDGSY